tara:strand:+ start:75 stop:305 length:231 start_codon:yes stop_codon:yes gene_type:complete
VIPGTPDRRVIQEPPEQQVRKGRKEIQAIRVPKVIPEIQARREIPGLRERQEQRAIPGTQGLQERQGPKAHREVPE